MHHLKRSAIKDTLETDIVPVFFQTFGCLK